MPKYRSALGKTKMNKKRSGILLHVSSIAAEYGIGDLGPQAYKFIELLSSLKQSYWQILPLNPTDAINGNSPYSSNSAFAVNPIFLSLDYLVEEGLLDEKDLPQSNLFSKEKVDYDLVYKTRADIFDKLFTKFKSSPNQSGFEQFCNQNSVWLDDYAMFVVIKKNLKGQIWSL